jgi:branched-chain amino acid transport system permease protein
VLEFVIAGLAIGSVFSLAAVGVVLTYVSTGVLNFAFASEAFFVARFFYWLNTQHGWSPISAGVVSLLVLAPAMGAFLWFALFRFLRLAPDVIKIVSTIGLSVAMPPIALLLFGDQPILTVPGLAPQPVHVYHLAGVSVTLDQLIAYCSVVFVVAAGALVLRYTSAGLVVRATVDSPAMAMISGVAPGRVELGVWTVSTTLAGLAGVLGAPIVGLDVSTLTVLVAASFAAVIIARFRSLVVAVIAAIAMGVITSLFQRYVPSSAFWSAALVPSTPFVFIFIAVLYLGFTRRDRSDLPDLGGELDRAIAPQVADVSGRSAAAASRSFRPIRDRVAPVAAMICIGVMPAVLGPNWTGYVGLGLAYGVAFLAYSLVIGDGGMIWLCQITFAGIGAVTTAELVTYRGYPFIGALVIAGLLTAVISLVVGVLTIRLGDLYVALVTLTFGLLIDNLVFLAPSIDNLGQGILLARPGFAIIDRSYSWLVLGIFIILALSIAKIRMSTLGMALSAVRWNEQAARALGVNVLGVKLSVSAFGAFIAAVGGGLLAGYIGAATGTSFDTFTGLVWLAVFVTVGVRSNVAAAVAGLAFAFVPALFLTYLPGSLSQIPAVLFGLGAILVARNPDGVLAMHARQLETAFSRGRRHSPGPPSPGQGAESRRSAVMTRTDTS